MDSKVLGKLLALWRVQFIKSGIFNAFKFNTRVLIAVHPIVRIV